MRLLTLFIFLIIISTACSTTTVYIVRHAEKVNETDTTDLTPAGYVRAAALAETLGKAGIDSIFSTPYYRTRQTAQALAKHIGVPVVDYAPKPTEAIVNRVKTIRGKKVLVVGHSNTILEIARGLGAKPTLAKIESGDFDNLFRVTRHHGPFRRSVTFVATTYGQQTAP
ncbi:SixA phosphatase family protein [Spirosoma fluviale]|uniref:Histidine phosphatase superfamily (Branch 1) n=1 Tax=Spirosoma fluviale TaxID=1597977 RepID=A0A286FZS0_9BACT|nr:phosphoglycerate mutase family protein [Spirosoma fluviale]SOD88755.1 Histidine phosphatase superfamily (branch 1) [Spirosoma fluviale]